MNNIMRFSVFLLLWHVSGVEGIELLIPRIELLIPRFGVIWISPLVKLQTVFQKRMPSAVWAQLTTCFIIKKIIGQKVNKPSNNSAEIAE